MRRLFEIVDMQGMTMEELSVRCGIAKDTISQWRRGKYAPKLANVEAVLNMCGYRLTVVGGADDDEDDE